MNTNALLVKVCGLKDNQNITDIDQLGVDYLGFIFYSKSKRDASELMTLPETNAKKVGVFVNEELSIIQEKIIKLKLSVIQLHGEESPEFCAALQELGVSVWKVFGMDENFDFSLLASYSHCDLFLFDTKSPLRGGTGKQFDWDILKNIPSEYNFILSGGISSEHGKDIAELHLPNLVGVDLNSKFEIAPGLKNVMQLSEFIKQLR